VTYRRRRPITRPRRTDPSSMKNASRNCLCVRPKSMLCLTSTKASVRLPRRPATGTISRCLIRRWTPQPRRALSIPPLRCPGTAHRNRRRTAGLTWPSRPLIDIGRLSPAFPVTPPDMRVRIRRFGVPASVGNSRSFSVGARFRWYGSLMFRIFLHR
jgi:hypothetical protein